jgi:hemolysin III
MTAPATVSLPIKPVFRGWSHAAAAIAAIAATMALGWETRADPPRLLSMLVYGATLVALYATSALYHIGEWRGRWRTTLRAIDHANIFFVIAGTYTPI